MRPRTDLFEWESNGKICVEVKLFDPDYKDHYYVTEVFTELDRGFLEEHVFSRKREALQKYRALVRKYIGA